MALEQNKQLKPSLPKRPSPLNPKLKVKSPAKKTQKVGSNQGGNLGDTASSLLVGEQLNKTIDEICAMGFAKDQVIQAMKAAYNNPDRAIEYLFNVITHLTEHKKNRESHPKLVDLEAKPEIKEETKET